MTTVNEFIAAHGGDPVMTEPGVLLLPDGARVVLNGPMLYRPPEESYRRNGYRLRYARLRLEYAEEAQRHFWTACDGGAPFAWDAAKLGPAPEAWTSLYQPRHHGSRDWSAENDVKARLAAMVADRRAAHDSLKREIEATALPCLV